MKINDLNIIAQRLGAFGKEHLGIDPRGHTVPTTSSLGGRIVNWIRSRHSDTAAQANRDVALLQGTLAAARAQGALSPDQDAAFKRAETLVRLSQSLARGGLDETALFTLDGEIDRDKTLSPEEKAARKAQLRQNNPEAVSWLLGAAARQMEAAGLPGMPIPGQTAQAAPAPQDAPQSDFERRWASFERH